MNKIINKKFIINGQEYTNLDEIPEKYKHLFVDKNNNSIPDIAENQKTEKINLKIIVNSEVFPSWKDVPENYKSAIQINSTNPIPEENLKKKFKLIKIGIIIFLIVFNSLIFLLFLIRNHIINLNVSL